MNGFAALDIPPCRRYVVVKATAGFAVCRLMLKSLLFYSCLDFTQNFGGDPPMICIVRHNVTLLIFYCTDILYSTCNIEYVSSNP